MRVMLDGGAYTPKRAHPTDAGLDLRAKAGFEIAPYNMVKVDTGVHLALPAGTVGFIKSKSGLMAQGITADGTIDEPYRGSIHVVLFNHTGERKYFAVGDKIAQLVVQPVRYESVQIVEELDKTDRGENGFGSTGK